MMQAFIDPPKRIPLILRFGIWISERITGRIMLPARILAWYPKAAIGSGVMEALVAHEEGRMNRRMLKLIRMAASYAAACPFCVDMNSHEYHEAGISDEEAESLRGSYEKVTSFSDREKLAITYARTVSQTPLKLHPDLVERVKSAFNEREFVILVSTAAQVNYWARLIQVKEQTMERKTQTGYLVLADISGYTSFVAQTEIEHAGLALSYLLETIVEKLDDLLTISKLEGDAVFAYIEEDKLEDCKLLLALIDQTYLAFRDKALSLYNQATCPCRACRALPTLDLKIMLHHGEFVLQKVAGIRDLLGTDVNLIHRLLKNGVSESTGWKGYALFTDQALEQMQCSKDNYFKRCETYEHLGEVNIYCMDMHVRYEEMKAS